MSVDSSSPPRIRAGITPGHGQGHLFIIMPHHLGQSSAHDNHDTHATGVNNTSLPQHRQLFRRAVQGFLSSLERLLPQHPWVVNVSLFLSGR